MTASEECLSVRATRWEDWRITSRRLLICGAAPETIHWIDGRSKTARKQSDLFGASDIEQSTLGSEAEAGNDEANPSSASPFRVPKPFLNLARQVACHRSPGR
ncbi:MAG: hypothetical protein ABJF25_08405 [Rhodopirellula bahusiensis]